jgi:hypothetical protein
VESKTIRLYQDGGVSDVVAPILFAIGAVAALYVVASGVFVHPVGGPMAFVFWAWIVFASLGGAALARASGRAGSFLTFTNDRVESMGGFPVSDIYWNQVARVDCRLHDLSEGGQRMVVLHSKSGTQNDSITIQVARVRPPEALAAALSEILLRCDPSVIELDILALWALAIRVDRFNVTAAPSEKITTFALYAGARRSLSHSTNPDARAIAALSAYMASRREEALSGVSSDGGEAWDMVLCEALCLAKADDPAGGSSRLKKVLAASPPIEVTRVLEAASTDAAPIEQGHRADGAR